MNIRFKDEIPIVYCHECEGDKELFEIVHRGKDLFCAECNAHLGYEWDLPAQFLAYTTGGDL